ncbi:MAG: hypothetical protein Q9211_004060 [Gyalolechia sp. 1 TL-2023]
MYLLRCYEFHTAILSVNKRIHQIAHAILYQENRFIVVSSDWDLIIPSMVMHQVSLVVFKRNHVASFEQHVTRLHLAFASKYFKDRKEQFPDCKTFIMLHNDLPDLVRMLHILDLCYGGIKCPFGLTLRVDPSIPGTSDLSFQKELLEPFRRLTSPGLNVKILGCVDTGYAQGLVADMTYPIRWARVVVWQLYSIMVSIIKAAEEASRLGYDYTTAFAIYEECKRVWSRARTNNTQLLYVEDSGFYTSCAVLLHLCDINLAFLRLRDPDATVQLQCAESFLSKTADMNSRITSLIGKSKIYHYRGVASAILGRDKDARRYILKSVRHNHKSIRRDPENQPLRYHRTIIKRRIAATSDAEKVAAGAITVDGLQPIPVPDPYYDPSKTIANERYLLRRLNYKGDLLPQIAATRTTNTQRMEKVFQRLNTHRRSVPADDVLCLWVNSHSLQTEVYHGPRRRFALIPDLLQPHRSTSS